MKNTKKEKSFVKIMILGHSGFIGSSLEVYLNKMTNWAVTGKSLPELDLSDERQSSLLIPFMDMDTTIVLAAAVKRQFGDTMEVFQKNMQIIENIGKLLKNNPVKRVIFMSSAAVYGEETENNFINEDSPVNPTSYYGIYKFSAECILKKICLGTTSLICLRPPLVYGKNDFGKTYGPSGFCIDAMEGKTIHLWGDGKELREFIYIEDLCKIIQIFVEGDHEGIFNIASGNSYSFDDIVKILEIRYKNLKVVSKLRSKAKVDNVFDSSKIKIILPASFKFTPLTSGIEHILTRV